MGRKHPSFRPTKGKQKGTDDVIISAQLMPSHSVSIHETEDYHRKLKTRRELRNRLKTIIEWLKINYKDYCSKNGVVPITQAQIDDPSFFQHNNREDLNYERLNVGLIKAFLSARKVKGNGKKCSFSHF